VIKSYDNEANMRSVSYTHVKQRAEKRLNKGQILNLVER